MDKITVKVTKQDAKNAKDFSDNDHCLFATALRRVFPAAKSRVYTFGFVLNGDHYIFRNGAGKKIRESYDYKSVRVRIRADFKPFQVSAVKVTEGKFRESVWL